MTFSCLSFARMAENILSRVDYTFTCTGITVSQSVVWNSNLFSPINCRSFIDCALGCEHCGKHCSAMPERARIYVVPTGPTVAYKKNFDKTLQFHVTQSVRRLAGIKACLIKKDLLKSWLKHLGSQHSHSKLLTRPCQMFSVSI